jgi:transposase
MPRDPGRGAGQAPSAYGDAWLKRAMRSRLEPTKKVARSIRAHQGLILNWFAAQTEFLLRSEASAI